MHKGLLIPGVALLLAGCVASQTETAPVRVDDLSTERAASTPAQYTVKSGDTLYGIAWRHDMDYRDLADLNDIKPPYRIQPGQRLALNAQGADAETTEATTPPGSAESGNGASVDSDSGAVATGVAVAGGVSGSAADADSATSGEDESLDWLLPADGGASADAPTDGESAPGPVYAEDEPAASEEADTASEDEGESDGEDRDISTENTDSADEEADSASEDGTESDVEADASESTPETQMSTDAEDTRVAQSDTEESAAESSDQAVSNVSAGQDSSARQYTPVDPVPWQWPASGNVVGEYGEGGSITAGIDISGQKGQPVEAAGPGIVVYAGSGVRGYGKLILLKHNDQFLSAYAHNDSLKVKENDVVRAGEVIATMGDSDAQDVRLHFEVRKDGQPQDPLEYLPAR